MSLQRGRGGRTVGRKNKEYRESRVDLGNVVYQDPVVADGTRGNVGDTDRVSGRVQPRMGVNPHDRHSKPKP